MKAAWPIAELGQVLTLKRGYDLPTRLRRAGPYPIVSSSGFTGTHDQAKVTGPGVVTGRYGTLGEVFYVRTDFWPLNTSLYVVDFKGNDPRFTSYFLRTLSIASKNAAGAVPGVNRNHLHRLKVRIPPIGAQKAIASILSAYDDLIENNLRRIRILEDMARLLYQEWFVKFRFPGNEKVRMVDSPLGKIPEGWEVVPLSMLVNCIRTATRPGSHLVDRRYVPIDCIPGKSLTLREWRPLEEAKSSLILFESGDILFGAMRPYFHKVVVAPFPGVTRTTCLVLRPTRKQLQHFALLRIFQDDVIAFATAHSKGATIPYASWDDSLASMVVWEPAEELLAAFNAILDPIICKLTTAHLHLQNLTKAKDLLLPKLISGEIDVSKLDIAVAEEVEA